MKLNTGDESIPQMWNPEHEHYATFYISGPVSNDFACGSLVTIPQGFTTNDRVGKRVVVEAIHVQGTIRKSSDVTPFSRFYYALVYDKFPTGSVPNPSAIFQDNGDYGREFRELANSHRFKILHKRNFNIIGHSGGDYTSKTQHWFQDYILVNLPMVFKDSTVGDINDVEQGAFYFVYSGEPLATADIFDIYMGGRTYFTDM